MPTPTPLTGAPIRLMVVDDDVHFQQDLVAALNSAADIQLVGLAGTRALALEALSGPAADVLLCDLGLPDGSGIDVIRAAQTLWPECAAMVSTIFGDEAKVLQSVEAGATGYLLKDSSAASIVDEIRSLHAGGSPISPLIARQILRRFRERERDIPAARSAAQAALSAREQQVLELISKGFSYEEIAVLMQISRNTVLTFVRRIYRKLEVRSRSEAIYEARSQGLLAE
jgi:DNA-binding NarL/FixJ family response regulator